MLVGTPASHGGFEDGFANNAHHKKCCCVPDQTSYVKGAWVLLLALLA